MKKQIVITGISRGLGRAMTQGFIEQGHQVWGCARSESAMEALRQQFGPDHDFAAVDVTNDAQVEAWARRLLNSTDPPDLLINNAGIVNNLAPLWQIPVEEFSQVIDVNIKGVANVLRHFLPAMIERGSGIIINFSSGWGRSTAPNVAPYCASKWAIEGLTRSLAQSLPAGMAAIPLDPGIIDTDMLQIVMGEGGLPHESVDEWVQRAVPFLLKLTPQDNGAPLSVPIW